MTILLEATRPYERLDRFDKTIVDAQIKAFLAHVRRQSYSKPAATPSSPPVCVQNGNAAQPAPKATKPRNTDARKNVLAAIAEHGPLTKTEIAEHANTTVVAIITTLSRMTRDNLLHIVGRKTGGRGQRMNVYHTDPGFVYVEPDAPEPLPPSPVAVIEAKRVARIPSIAAVDRGHAVIKANFHSDGMALDLFNLIYKRPRSAVELMHDLHAKRPIDWLIRQMEGYGIVENIGRETTVDRLGRKHHRAVYAVKE